MTKLEIELNKDNTKMRQCMVMYGAMDETKKVVANFAYMDLIERIKLRDMGSLTAAELAVKLIAFVRLG